MSKRTRSTQIISKGRLVDVTPEQLEEVRRTGSWFTYTTKRLSQSHHEAIGAMRSVAAPLPRTA